MAEVRSHADIGHILECAVLKRLPTRAGFILTAIGINISNCRRFQYYAELLMEERGSAHRYA